MHKRIEKIANLWAVNSYIKDNKVYYLFTDHSLQAFTKSIVKDCADIANGKEDPEVDIGDRMKKFYGVVE